MKEFHIISSGLSLITNAQKAGVLEGKGVREEEYWDNVLQDRKKIDDLFNFLAENPKENSAELNTFLRVVEGKEPKNIEVYLFGTKTKSNELCRRVIERFLKEKGFIIYIPYEVSGYFWDAQFDESVAKNEFQKGISELLDRLIYLAMKKQQEGYKVYFNPTGGFKAHVIATALAGFMTNSEIYYMHEEFNDVIFIPLLFYLPKGKEIDVLKKISDKCLISGDEARTLVNESQDEVNRLQVYGLIEVEKDQTSNSIYRIKITNKGKLIIEQLRQIIK